MVIAANRVNPSSIKTLDHILFNICEKVQLTSTQHQLARDHYMAVGDWLDKEGSLLAQFNPSMYPQGSLAMDTTNKPLTRSEYDLDFVCEFNLSYEQIEPKQLVHLLAERLKAHGLYSSMMEECERCIRLIYEHDFHLDIVPACSHSQLGQGQILIPDGNRGWRHTNPKGYLDWFAQRTHISRVSLDSQEPLDPPESTRKKAPLKLAIQLMKRYRDLSFITNANSAPVSILLSTLAANYYQGEYSVYEAVSNILGNIRLEIQRNAGRRITVENPVNVITEDFGERWDRDPGAYDLFVDWVNNFSLLWQRLPHAQGYQNLADLLKQLFDEQTTEFALKEYGEYIRQKQVKNELYVAPAGAGLTTSSFTGANKITVNTPFGA
jgi:Second Messenger Oligonucleotide or Dinucleotide Synthetase domain